MYILTAVHPVNHDLKPPGPKHDNQQGYACRDRNRANVQYHQQQQCKNAFDSRSHMMIAHKKTHPVEMEIGKLDGL